MHNRQNLFTTLITQRITSAGPTQLYGIKEYVKWAVCVGLTIIFLINSLRMAPWCRNM
jgi:hypothetical protein